MIAGVVVAGGGLAALELALALRKLRRDLPITVVSTESEVIYRPWLIKVPAGGPEAPVVPFARLLSEAGVSVVSDRAARVDAGAHELILESGAALKYGQLVVATGATADRDRVPGGHDHALFPCDADEATKFAARVASGPSSVAVVFGWERPGPGLEYAAWLAARQRGITVSAIDGDGTLERRVGERATAHIRALFERRGGRLISEGRVRRIDDRNVELEQGVVTAAVIALASPLRGCTSWLPEELRDERGMLRVDSSLAAAGGVFGIGDVIAVPEGYRLAPTLFSIRSTAKPLAANVIRSLEGIPLKPILQPGQPDILGPDLDGEGVLIRDRRLVVSGRLPLMFRALTDRRYLRSRRAQFAHPQRGLTTSRDVSL